MQAGVQEAFEHRIFKPHLPHLPPPPLATVSASCREDSSGEREGDREREREMEERHCGEDEEEKESEHAGSVEDCADSAGAEGRVPTRINLTFHVHL